MSKYDVTDDPWWDANEWLADNKCLSCDNSLICEVECYRCEKLADSLIKLLRETRKAAFQELLPLFKEELKQVQGGGYEGEIAIETCIDIVEKKLK